jgi:hypothetical protein
MQTLKRFSSKATLGFLLVGSLLALAGCETSDIGRVTAGWTTPPNTIERRGFLAVATPRGGFD